MLKYRKTTPLILLILCLIVPVAALAGVKARVSVRVGTLARPHAHFHYQVRPVRLVHTHRVTYGAVDFNVRPQRSRIYVDGHYLGIADQFNGYPQTATLPAGYHNIRIEAPNGQIVRQRIYVAAGKEFNFNLKF